MSKPQRYGFCTVRCRQRHKQGAPQGMRPGWEEWQVWHGRKIISRHELWKDAVKSAEVYSMNIWEEIYST
jgi:hypothetical protein